ncbi:MAG TPA: hypothetical protein VF662_03280 [Allosphingosinicella sp.]|jgi:hypothetical protein
MSRLKMLALLCAASTITAAPLPAQLAAEPQPKAADQKPICRYEPVVGSIRLLRVCKTKEQWTAKSAADAQQADRLRDRSQRMGSINP